MNAKLECGCGNLLSGGAVSDRTVSDRITCADCGSQYVVTTTRIADGESSEG